jgi:hypothetical protein
VTLTPQLTKLYAALWPEGDTGEKLYALLDGARDPRIFGAVDASYQDKYCLYSGERRWPGEDLGWDLVGISPYLVEMDKSIDLTDVFLRQGWNESWGVFCRSDAGISRLRNHFRGLLVVRSETNKKLLFRFYDPRVLRAYLPTCTASELRTVFGPVDAFVMPGAEPGTALECRFDGMQLIQKELIRQDA